MLVPFSYFLARSFAILSRASPVIRLCLFKSGISKRLSSDTTRAGRRSWDDRPGLRSPLDDLRVDLQLLIVGVPLFVTGRRIDPVITVTSP
jgi:hypothetical protein